MLAPKKPAKEILKNSQSLKMKKKIGKIVIFSVSVIFILSVLGYILYRPSLSVQNIYVQGNNILESTEVISSINEKLEGKYWYLFPRKSIFIYPKKEIINDLLKDYPRLLSVKIGLGEWDSLVIDVEERDSDIIWCKNGELPKDVLGQEIEAGLITLADDVEENILAEENVNQNCYFSDYSGFIFAPAPYFSHSVFVELSGLLSPQSIATTPLEKTSYSTVTNFAKNLAKVFNKTNYHQYRLIKIKINDKNNYEAVIADTVKGGNYEWKIFFDNGENADELTNNLYTVLNSVPFKEEMEKNKDNLASIDLRYGKKVFYKFKN